MTRQLGDDEEVTQYGNSETEPNFRKTPRLGTPHPHAMSVTIGRRSPSDMASLVGRRPVPKADRARYARVGELRRLGFSVVHDPVPGNASHALVNWPDDWDDTVSRAFESCFGED